jgi:hypothetical protein
MKNVKQIFDSSACPVSVEIFPPKGDLTLEAARELTGGLAQFYFSYVFCWRQWQWRKRRNAGHCAADSA